jgi:hypothetical protein
LFIEAFAEVKTTRKQTKWKFATKQNKLRTGLPQATTESFHNY